MKNAAMQDEVRLTVPALPEFVRLARVTATGLASRLGFTYDEVEDLRLAIDELCYSLIGHAGMEGTLTLRYELAPDALRVTGTGHFTGRRDGKVPALSELSRQILKALVDEYDASLDGDGRPSFRLVKRLAGSGRG